MSKSGLVPDEDFRLTININKDLHTRLRVAAARERTTIGEMIECLVMMHLDKDSPETMKVGSDCYRIQKVWVKV